MSAVLLEDRLGTAWKKPPLISNPMLRWGLLIAAAVYLVLATASIDVNWSRVAEGLSRGWAFIASFFNPDFVSRGTDIRDGILESVIITVASTVVGILISIPIGLGAARNIAPLAGLPRSAAASSHSRGRSTRSSWPSCWWRSSGSGRSPVS
jgi:phosphonate transport system permease protein